MPKAAPQSLKTLGGLPEAATIPKTTAVKPLSELFDNNRLAGLYEWNVIEFGYYRSLTDLLPKIEEPSPIAEIFAGRDNNE